MLCEETRQSQESNIHGKIDHRERGLCPCPYTSKRLTAWALTPINHGGKHGSQSKFVPFLWGHIMRFPSSIHGPAVKKFATQMAVSSTGCRRKEGRRSNIQPWPPQNFHTKRMVFFPRQSQKKNTWSVFPRQSQKKTPEVCNESIIETLNWCLHHSATDLIFQTKRLKSYSGKRPQTVWGVRSQCTKYKQEQLWNSNKSGQTLAQLQQQDLLYRSI